MRSLQTRISIAPALLNRQILRLERRGQYENALALISEDWAGDEFVPEIDGLTERESAELLLRFGSLIGFHGHKERIAGAQERSKDLLTQARSRLLELGETELVAACDNYLALAYWRTCEFREAELFLEEAFAHELPRLSDSRLYSHIIRSMILVALREHTANVEYCRSVESDFQESKIPFFQASFYANLGISLKDLDQIQDALSCLNLARSLHRKARHHLYSATVDNNLALLYKQIGRFDKGHESVDSAINIYKRLKDRTREGSSIETKAQIYFAEGRLDDALKTIDRSIAILRKSENSGYLAESIIMRSKILLFSDRFVDAVLALMEAVELTRQQAGEAFAKGLIEEFETALNESRLPKVQDLPIDPSQFELIIPPELAKYDSYRGVWINNSYLENIGIPSGSLAVTVNNDIRRGDLVAVVNNATGAVICGFYDAEFGIVCLDLPAGEPQLFNQDEITVTGKIIGVCRDDRDAGGKMIVEPIRLRPIT